MKKLLIKNCSFVPELTEGYAGTCGDVLVEDGKIAAIGENLTDAEARVLDIGGKTLIPGIIDMHVHLGPVHGDVRVAGKSIFESYKFAKYLMSIGVTTVRDCGNDYFLPATALREAIKEGLLRGPRILSSGNTLSTTAVGNEYYTAFITEHDGPVAMRKAARDTFKKGADFIKMTGSGSIMSPGSDPGMRILEDDEILEVVKIANLFNSHVAVHAHGADAVYHCIKCGVRTVEHASFIDQRSIDLLKGNDEQGITMTLSVLLSGLDANESSDPTFAYVNELTARIAGTVKSCLKNAYDQGVLIGWGTDIELQAYQRDPGMEFRARKELGIADLDILKQATINSAKLLMLDDVIGTVKVGKAADLIVVDGKPQEDISCMYHPPVHVVCAGRLVEEDD